MWKFAIALDPQLFQNSKHRVGTSQIFHHYCHMVFDLLKENIEKRVALPEDAWNRLVSLLTIQNIKKREVWHKAGDVTEIMGFVTKGCLRTYFTDEKGHEHIVQFAFEDWWTSDLMSFVTQEPSAYSIEALEETTVAVLHKNDYEQLLIDFPIFERFFRLLVQGAYVAGQMRMIAVMSKNAEQRYTELVKKYPALEMRVAQHQIASYLGITPEALSRIKRTIIEKSKSQGF
jgi:CRP-like cAMP-binding protein